MRAVTAKSTRPRLAYGHKAEISAGLVVDVQPRAGVQPYCMTTTKKLFSTSKEERDSFLALAREEEEAEEAEARRAAEHLKKARKTGSDGKEWDAEGVSRKIVEKLRKEGRGSDDAERYERMARAQEYRLKRQMDKQQEEEQARLARIERQMQAERERREAEEKQKEEEKKKGWFSSLFR